MAYRFGAKVTSTRLLTWLGGVCETYPPMPPLFMSNTLVPVVDVTEALKEPFVKYLTVATDGVQAHKVDSVPCRS